jgi:hypothetical protein
MKYVLGIFTAWLLTAGAYAHDGPLDAHGCHHDHNVGGYHCHRGTFAGHYFESKEEMLQMLQLHLADPRLTEEIVPESAEDIPAQHENDS